MFVNGRCIRDICPEQLRSLCVPNDCLPWRACAATTLWSAPSQAVSFTQVLALGHWKRPSWLAMHAFTLLCRSRPHPLRSVRMNVHLQAKVCASTAASPVFLLTFGLLEALHSSDFFDREIEQSRLLHHLKNTPTKVLVIVGPRSSGKSRLLDEVLLNKHQGLVTFLNGRAQKLTDAGIMTSALREQAQEQLPVVRQRLEEFKDLVGKAASVAAVGADLINRFTPGLNVKSLAAMIESAEKQFKQSDPRSLNDLIKTYDSLLSLSSKITPQNVPLPVICIDEANVLMEWYKGGAAMENDLDALLRFFLKVIVPLVVALLLSVSTNGCV